MPTNPDSQLLVKASKLLREAPLDAELKLLLVEMVVRMEDDRLAELLEIIEEYTKDVQKDDSRLKDSLKKISTDYDSKMDQLVQQTESELNKLESEISEEEKEGKIEEVKKRIKES
ncbi:MAG: hypothetical protein COY66_04545 [Candidatus Kerfeldbacteria bacterium CG_4_10_14_0_8_um_filter_42_10]|uniref:Uncharacterized protein n=1 Tax=Candidatus Kerfeldbacteria bacterium CG_4_10_14_0_8_um_filter_42_10 TaxID=2014248 RepID=A0A2M7RHR4_9BACT|nr:MAG: hypothetical protein COY66_04545 [Candidatus Kerfeldbacteria bacterium CG_4_10_14_0_8_um_filter_42_10]